MIVVSNRRDTAGYGEQRPFTARSLALSVLLGTHPPELPVRALITLAELFGIAPGTMRTALSRLVAARELELDDGRYRLVGTLLERQRSQDIGRLAPTADWDWGWHSVVAAPDQRVVAARRAFRTIMANHRFGELRADIWMRPSNLAAPPPDRSWIVLTGRLDGIDATHLVDRLWDVDGIADRAHHLVDDIVDLRTALDWADPGSIPTIFTTSATVVRFLRDEPLLPKQLLPEQWPVDALRLEYDRVESDFQDLLRTFLRAA